MQTPTDSPAAEHAFVLGHDIPRGAKLTEIIERYEDLPQEIPCGLAHCHQLHKNGFLVQYQSENRPGEGRLGKDCGKTHFGPLVWQTHMKAYRAKTREAELRASAVDQLALCAMLRPHADYLQELARDMKAARSKLEIHAANLTEVCRDAGRHNYGVLTFERHGKADIKMRLPGHQFWIRDGVLSQANRLAAEVRNFPGRIAAAKGPKEVGDAISLLGAPRDRIRDLVNILMDDVQALFPDNMVQVWKHWQAGGGQSDRFRVEDGKLEEWEDLRNWGYPDRVGWKLLVDLLAFQEAHAGMATIKEAIAYRQAA